jgi:Lsr2
VSAEWECGEGNHIVAKRTVYQLVDDIDGSVAAETVRFGVDGIQYEIDLSATNATRMRDVLARYVQAGSKVGSGGGTAVRTVAGQRRGSDYTSPDQNSAIREWARAKGLPVSDRGRIRQDIIDRYQAEAGR